VNPTSEQLRNKKPRKSDNSIYVCKCECGGRVRGVWDFGMLWSWCEQCTPKQTVTIKRKRAAK